MPDNRRSQFAREALARAERSPLIESKNPAEWSNLRTRAVARQAHETVERATRSERTYDSGKPR